MREREREREIHIKLITIYSVSSNIKARQKDFLKNRQLLLQSDLMRNQYVLITHRQTSSRETRNVK